MKNNLLGPFRSRRSQILLVLFGGVILIFLIAFLVQPDALRLAGAALKLTKITCSGISEIPADECSSLENLYLKTGGENWRTATDWFQSDNPCSWHGVVCVEKGGQLQVVELYLSNNGMTGLLPVELTQLDDLKKIDLRRNQISGPIPAGLGTLKKLVMLDMSQNQISGSIPPELGQLGELEQLILSYNELSGSIPGQLGDLQSLTGLYLNYNRLEGPIPVELGQLENLQQLFLSGNLLSGEIPTSLGNLSNLVILSLEGNQLSGVVPPELGKLSNLERLQIQDNHLSGELPEDIASLHNLATLIVSSNQFTGDIPRSFSSLEKLSNENGQVVDFGYNALRSSDPGLIAFISNLDVNWQKTQTIPPGDLAAKSTSEGINLNWTPIPFQAQGGYYEISYAASPDGPFTVHGVTLDKSSTTYLVDGLQVDQVYTLRIRTYTPPHLLQRNELWSDYAVLANVIFAGTMTSDPGGQHPVYLPIIRK